MKKEISKHLIEISKFHSKNSQTFNKTDKVGLDIQIIENFKMSSYILSANRSTQIHMQSWLE